jgi:CubicO group peptidase (beta-lactamase class C family)
MEIMFTRRSVCTLLSGMLACMARAQMAKLDPAAIEAVAKAELEATHTPGAAIGIVEDGRLIYAKGFGTRNLETGEPVTGQTLFRLGSTTKMETAAAVATLAAGGRIDFGSAVGRYISGLDPAIGALTVNQILSHTAGLKDEAVMNGRHDDAALGEEIRRWKADWLFTRPGAIYSYANPGFWLAGFLAETVAGKPYADAMEDLVFRPVGMTWTTLRPTMAMTRVFSQGHDMVDGRMAVLRPAPDNAANWPAGSIFSNPPDLARFATALMNDGRIDGRQVLPAKAVAEITTPHADIPGSKAKYGYGLQIETSEGIVMWSHAGSRAGYGSSIEMIPSRKLAVIVLCNRTGQNLARTRRAILQMEGVAQDPPGHGSTFDIEAADFAKYIGTYRNGATRHQIVEKDGKLRLGGKELKKTADGFLVQEGGPGRIFPIAGADGRIEYLFMGGRAVARER